MNTRNKKFSNGQKMVVSFLAAIIFVMVCVILLATKPVEKHLEISAFDSNGHKIPIQVTIRRVQ